MKRNIFLTDILVAYMRSHNIDGTPQCTHMRLVLYIDDKSGFGLSFVTERKDLCFFETPKRQTIHFYLWDSFLNSNCEEFLCPIYIDSTGKSTEPKLIADLKKLNGLLELILQNQSVRMIELYFSDGCATLSDFRQEDVPLNGFAEWMLEQYRQEHDLPVVKVSIRRSSGK